MAFRKNDMLYDVRTGDLVRHFGVQAQTVQRWCREGRVPFLRIGGRYWFNLEAVKAAITEAGRDFYDDI